MKKLLKNRIIPLILCAVLCAGLLQALPPKADAAGVTFFAVDETLLELGYGSIYYGGELYVSPGVFTNVEGVYSSYSGTQKLLNMYNASNTLVFDLNAGTAYTVGGSNHSVSATTSGGSIYVPLNFCCTYFGVSYSYFQTDLGPMIRLKTGQQVLSDTTFVSAVSAVMKQRYDAYTAAHPEQYTPPVKMALCLCGSLSDDTGELLDYLRDSSVPAAFFTDAESIRSYPEIILRIYTEGHAIGALAETSEEAEDFNEALDALLMTKTRLLIGDGALADAGYAVVSPNVDARGVGERVTFGSVSNSIARLAGGSAVIRMDISGDTALSISRIAAGVGIDRSWFTVDETTGI